VGRRGGTSIALYGSLIADDFEQAVLLSVNHSGDSDSTGAITGNICGALYGVESIPSRWLEAVELRKEIAELAVDLFAMATGTLDEESQKTWERYPGY
jgi:ADP-ribosylglycohydrolase